MAKWPAWLGMFYDGVWNDVTAWIYDRDPISTSRGKTDESAGPVPSSLTLTLDNRDSRWTPGNPTSPLYGKVGRNTPVQLCSGPPVLEDFEDTTFAFTWGFTGTGSWARSSTLAHRGTWSFASAAIADGQQSGWQIDAPAGMKTVSFWINASIGSSSFAVASTSEGFEWFVRGSTPGWQLVTVDLGTSTWVNISYQRNNAGGSNVIYVDDLRYSDARFTGELAKIVPKRSPEFDPNVPGRGDSWAELTAGGLLRRIGASSRTADSPIKRAVLRAVPAAAAYWPCEEPQGAAGCAEILVGGAVALPVTTVRYTLPDGTPLVPGGLPKLAADDGVPGSGPIPSLVDGGTLAAAIPVIAPGSYGIDWVGRFNPGGDAGGTTSADVFSWREVGGTYVHFTINVVLGSVVVFYSTAADDLTLTATGSATAFVNVYDGAPHHFRFQAIQNGANIDAYLYVDGLFFGKGANFATPGVMAGTVGRPASWEFNPGEDRGGYMPAAAGHVHVWPLGLGQPDTFTPTFGNPGDLCADRALRIAAEEGWTLAIRNRVFPSDHAGPQPADTIPAILAECERTEDGLVYDQRGAVAVSFRNRRGMYTSTVRLALTYGTSALQPLEPVFDDQAVANDVTAKNRDGAQIEALKITGALAAIDPLAGGVGRYQQTVNVNTNGKAAQLTQIAWWWSNKGTVEGARHPVIVIDLDADPTLATAVSALDMGDRITIARLEADLVDLRVLGIREVQQTRRRLVTLLCEPYRQFDVARYASGVVTQTQKRYESRTSTLNAGVAADVSPMVVTFTTAADAWSTTSVPYDWTCSGERITVTAIGAVAGTGPFTQSATVTRGVNGVSKALTAGAQIRMHDAMEARYAL